MRTTRLARSLAVAAALTVVAGVGAAQAMVPDAPSGSLPAGRDHAAHTTIHLTTKRLSLQQVDAAPAGPSAGDQTLIGGQVTAGPGGYSSADCVTVTTTVDGGIAQCEVDFVLSRGTIVTRGTSAGDDTRIRLAVVGGTGTYSGVSGSGSLLPTQTGTQVVLRLR